MSQVTKRALEASLKHLLLQKPLNKITINDIAEDCGINRMTFYYHFRDIYDLIDWICREEGSRAIAGRTDRETWQEGFCGLCRYVLENRSFFASVYHSISREQIENYLYSVIYDLLYRVVEEQSRGADIAEEDKRLIADFYKYGFAGAALDWLGGAQNRKSRLSAAANKSCLKGRPFIIWSCRPAPYGNGQPVCAASTGRADSPACSGGGFRVEFFY